MANRMKPKVTLTRLRSMGAARGTGALLQLNKSLQKYRLTRLHFRNKTTKHLARTRQETSVHRGVARSVKQKTARGAGGVSSPQERLAAPSSGRARLVSGCGREHYHC
ncbi:unnamed protein product [Leptosia nina]|uniref:Uncharacterized protein n=1 Tax=Leptosia nina TaxID=320188 RepID=A0AAV1JHR1_9NEOP